MQKQVQDDEELRKKLEKEEQELRAKLDESRAVGAALQQVGRSWPL